ncbi:MAG: hypothetical protein KOO66_04405 [Bacteroidales bacterium]|nr:hypothetical protein [Bacteroidales bacterium]
MSKYKLIQVSDKFSKKEFIRFPARLYKNEKQWVRPLDQDIENVFDPSKNKLFRNGEASLWILVNDKEETIGRIAVFYDKKTAARNDQPTGGMGFFDCINDTEAAFTLFDKCKDWLQEKGMEAMDGPINFGDRDRWWGCLVDGFEYPPNYCMPYNFPYYKDLFEAYGFENYFNQYTYYRLVNKEGLSDVIKEKAERLKRNPKYHFEHFDKKNPERFTEDFRVIYNKAWARFPGVSEMKPAHAKVLMKSLKPILDERIMWFAYFGNEPIAFFLQVPEINQIVKYLNGKMNLIGKLKFLFYKSIGKCDTVLGLIFGIIPEYQAKGIEGGIVMAFANEALKKNFPYKHLQFNWIGDFNPSMMKVLQQVGSKILKTHVTYRYLFDRSKLFKRAKKVNV